MVATGDTGFPILRPAGVVIRRDATAGWTRRVGWVHTLENKIVATLD